MPKLSCISPQLLCDVVETMKLLATRGRWEAAADLAHFLGTLDASPLTSGSPRRRRRKKKRKHSRRHYLAADMVSKHHRQYRGQFDIGSMSKTIDLLQDLYSPMKTSSLAPKPLELAQPQGGPVSGRAPATLPAPQPPTSFSKPLKDEGLKVTADAKHVEEILKVETYVKEAEVMKEANSKAKMIVQLEETSDEAAVMKEAKLGEKETKQVFLEQDGLTTDNKALSIDEAEETLDEAVIMKEAETGEKKPKQGWEVFLEQNVLATDNEEVKGAIDAQQFDEEPLVDTTQQPEVVDGVSNEEETNTQHGEEDKFNKEDKEEAPPKPFYPRHQEQRLRFGHLNPSKVKSLGRWTSWTRDSLHSELDAKFSKPRRGVLWSDFSPEEKLAHFDMIDWPNSCPDDPPSRSLMFKPESDCEAFLEQNWLTTDNKVEEEVLATQKNEEETPTDDVMELEEKVEVDDNKVTFSIEDLEYDYATGRLFIHLESGVVEVNNSQARDQLLAQMS